MEDETQHYVGKIAQKAIIEMDGKVLITKGIGDGDTWEFPGGRLHIDEEPLLGLQREIKEELGIAIPALTPIFVGRSLFKRNNTWRILIGWHGVLPSGTEFQIDSSEVAETRWLTRDELRTVRLFDDCREMANTFLLR